MVYTDPPYPVSTGGYLPQPDEPPPAQLVMALRDGAILEVTRAGSGWSSQRRSGNGTWLGGHWADLSQLAKYLRSSRPRFAALAREVFGVDVSPDYARDQGAWTYDSEQTLPERWIASKPLRCRDGELHIVSWDAAMDLGRGNAGHLLCLTCHELLSVRAEPRQPTA